MPRKPSNRTAQTAEAGTRPPGQTKPPGAAGAQQPEDVPISAMVNRTISPDRFFKVSAEYPDREGMVIYLYRLWPRIDRAQSDPSNPAYIECSKEITGKQDILHRWGAGSYQLFLTDVNRPKAQQRVCNCKIDLEDAIQEYPPVVDLRELIRGADRNRSYIAGLKARGLLDENGEPTMKPQGQGAPSANEILDVADRLNKMGGRPPAPGENKQVELAFKTSEKLIDHVLSQTNRMPQPKGGGNDALLLALLNQNAQLTMKLIDLAAKPPAHSNPTDGFEGMFKLMDMMSERFGFAAPKKKGIIAEILEGVPDALRAFVSMARADMSDPMQIRRQAPPPPTPPAAGPTITATVIEAEPGAPTPEPQGPTQQQLDAIRNTGRKMLECIAAGQDGAQFATGVEVFYGAAMYNSMAALGKQGLMDQLKMIPEIWQQVQQQQPAVETFIEEFVAYGQEEPEPAN